MCEVAGCDKHGQCVGPGVVKGLACDVQGCSILCVTVSLLHWCQTLERVEQLVGRHRLLWA